MMSDLSLFFVYLVILLLLAWPLSNYITHVFQGQQTFLDPVLRPIQKFIYKVSSIDSRKEMSWRQ